MSASPGRASAVAYVRCVVRRGASCHVAGPRAGAARPHAAAAAGYGAGDRAPRVGRRERART